MKQNIFFRNREDFKKKAYDLIDKYVDFKVEGDCIIIEKPDNVRITCRVEGGIKTKEISVDALFMPDVVDRIYKQFDLEELIGEPNRIIKIEILE